MYLQTEKEWKKTVTDERLLKLVTDHLIVQMFEL